MAKFGLTVAMLLSLCSFAHGQGLTMVNGEICGAQLYYFGILRQSSATSLMMDFSLDAWESTALDEKEDSARQYCYLLYERLAGMLDKELIVCAFVVDRNEWVSSHQGYANLIITREGTWETFLLFFMEAKVRNSVFSPPKVLLCEGTVPDDAFSLVPEPGKVTVFAVMPEKSNLGVKWNSKDHSPFDVTVTWEE